MRVAVLADLGHRFEHVGDDVIGLATAKKLQKRGFETVILSTDPKESRRLFSSEEIITTPQVGQSRLQGHTIYHQAKKLFNLVDESTDNTDKIFNRFFASDESIEVFASDFFAYNDPQVDYAQLPVMKDLAEVAKCDAIVIAGGGGIHSDYWWLALERALVGVVGSNGGKKPLVVTGGSFGPLILDEDRGYLSELVKAAGACAWRGGSSLALALKTLPDPDKHLLSCDDVTDYAISFAAENKSEEKTHILACFAPMSPGIDTVRLAKIYARVLDNFASELQLPVKLISHMADPADPESGDMGFSREIKKHMQAEASVEKIGDIDATIRHLKGAKVNITSRFHQGVFGLANAVPTLMLNSNFYTRERQNDLLENYGLDPNWALPVFAFEEEVRARKLVQDFCSHWEKIDGEYFTRHNQRLAYHQEKWWDWVAEYLRTGEKTTLATPPFLQSGYSFNTANELEAPSAPSSFVESNHFFHSQLVALNNATEVWLRMRYEQDWKYKYEQTLAQYQAELEKYHEGFCRMGVRWKIEKQRLEESWDRQVGRVRRLGGRVKRKLAFRR